MRLFPARLSDNSHSLVDDETNVERCQATTYKQQVLTAKIPLRFQGHQNIGAIKHGTAFIFARYCQYSLICSISGLEPKTGSFHTREWPKQTEAAKDAPSSQDPRWRTRWQEKTLSCFP